jgi:RNA polymerase sigma-70 factor (ECF subfamily)
MSSKAGPELLGQLLDRHAAALVLFARQWCGAPEDAVQEAFVQLAQQAECPRDPAAWLYRVVRNGAISAGRAEARRRRHEAQVAASDRGWFEDSTTTLPDAETAAAELARLPIEEREVIVAHVWGGLTFSQIGEQVGSSASTVFRRYQSGLAALRSFLGEQGEPCRTTNQAKNSPRN